MEEAVDAGAARRPSRHFAFDLPGRYPARERVSPPRNLHRDALRIHGDAMVVLGLCRLWSLANALDSGNCFGDIILGVQSLAVD